MSFYYRSTTGVPVMRSLRAIKLATLCALALYPLGCLVRLAASEGTAVGLALDIAGLLLVLAAIGAFAFMAPTNWQRIVGEEEGLLDERELQQRYRAQAFGYSVFAVLTMVTLIYFAIGTDIGNQKGIQVWLPGSFVHWSAFIWGAVLYAFTLPTAYLAWTVPPPPEEE
jgi:hypothetical protein